MILHEYLVTITYLAKADEVQLFWGVLVKTW